MSEPLKYQLRVYLNEQLAAEARADGHSPSLAPLIKILERHNATVISQLEAFEAYVADIEREGRHDDPLYKWTKDTIADPKMRGKHEGSFAIRVGGAELYDKAIADALESDLEPIVGGVVVERMSRHDTDPAKNIQFLRNISKKPAHHGVVHFENGGGAVGEAKKMKMSQASPTYVEEVYAACATVGYDSDKVRQLKEMLNEAHGEARSLREPAIVALAQKVQFLSIK